MKNRVLAGLLLLIVGSAFGQTVNGVPLKEIQSEYVQIIGSGKFLSEKVNIELDFGQKTSAWTKKDTQLLDSLGQKIELNSMIDALNFMASNGYELTQAYAFAVAGSSPLSAGQNVYHFLLRRKK